MRLDLGVGMLQTLGAELRSREARWWVIGTQLKGLLGSLMENCHMTRLETICTCC